MFNICVIKNIDSQNHVVMGVDLAPNDTYTIPDSKRLKASNDSFIIIQVSSGNLQIGDGSSFITSIGDQINYLKSGIKSVEARNYAFAEKVLPDGKKIFKRVHGVKKILTSNTDCIELIVPYTMAKINSIEIIGSNLGDTCNFKVYDNNNGTISTIPGLLLNQFGFDVIMRPEYHSEQSSYDADLIQGMKLEVEFTGNTGQLVGVNFILHEVK